MKKAFIIVDMQNDFIDGALGSKDAEAIIPTVVALTETASKDADTSLIFTMDTHTDDYMQTMEGKKLPIPHCIVDSKGWEITPALQSFVKEATIIEKATFGASSLPSTLIGVQEITLVGLCTDVCVISNALLLKAYYPNVPIRVVASACAGISPEGHATALAAMQACHIEIV